MRTEQAYKRITIAALAFTLALSGCAALTNPHPQSIPVTSTPTGAQVFVDGTLVGATPLTLELDGRTSYELVVRLNAEERLIPLETSISGTYAALDVLPGMFVAGATILVAKSAASDIEGPEAAGLLVLGIPVIGGIGSSVASVTVDAVSGQWLRLTPSHIHVTFD